MKFYLNVVRDLAEQAFPFTMVRHPFERRVTPDQRDPLSLVEDNPDFALIGRELFGVMLCSYLMP